MNAAQPAFLCRTGTRNDLGQVMQVMSTAFDPAFGEAWTRSQVEGMLDIPGTWLTVAACGQMIVGFSLMRSVLDEGELLLIAVDPDWQGRNIGRSLLLENISTARLRNIHHLHLEVRETNNAIGLYKSTGFIQCNTRKGYYHGQDGQLFDALSFTMTLEQKNKSA
ncbi:ribosomal protein S18-alanine N-acetyltransferase [Rhizorhapis sp. SPR117]|uniref:ribosomal protein S18-alanine N-acetyltransferase n=1 Tax=Rhizorhapis sp. SPR117 TaxID=2912611 RepID=UPI001F01163F|nr:ribosomal protein S18-alanine N-acetyltransferase [Rhizorhapis sp. SPR117]